VPSLAHLIDAAATRPVPPLPGTPVAQPAPPSPTPAPKSPVPWYAPLNQPMAALVTLDGCHLGAPTDGVVHTKPPTPPKQQ